MIYTEGGFNAYSTVDVENIDKFIKEREEKLKLESQRTKGKKPPTKGILVPDKNLQNLNQIDINVLIH